MTRLATLLDQKADLLSTIGQRVQARTDQSRDRWKCSKADGFRHAMEVRRRQADAMAAELHHLASQLRQVANRVQHSFDSLRVLENRARAQLAVAGHDRAWATARGVDLAHLPASGDPAWELIARRLGA